METVAVIPQSHNNKSAPDFYPLDIILLFLLTVIFMQDHEGRLINIRRFVAWDITLHGARFILLEFGLGTAALIVFGYWLMSTITSLYLGLYIFLVGINYLVLLVYAAIISSIGSAKFEVDPNLAHDKHFIRKYGLQQLLILVPFAVLIITLIQEITRLA